MEIKNKKAYFNYFVEDTKEAGIVLVGTEIKSVICQNYELHSVMHKK